MGNKKNHIQTVAALVIGLIFFTWQTASAGPITNPGGAPYVKAGIYQGVISIVPGGFGESVMEIGNAGRDIASTGSIYLRPMGAVAIAPQNTQFEGAELQLQGAPTYPTWIADVWQDRYRVYANGTERLTISAVTGNTYIVNGQLCFGNVGSTNCISGPGGPSSTPNLDAVLAASPNPGQGNAKTILLTNQASNAQSLGVSAGGSLGAGSYAFLMPYTGINGAYNPVTRINDSALIFGEGSGLTIGGWNATATKGIRVSGGTVSNAALAVNNGLAGTGGADDGIAAFANTVGSAIYAQQNNVAGLASYFSGKVEVRQTGTSGFTWGSQTTFRVGGNTSVANGAVADIRNTNGLGQALSVTGVTRIDGIASTFAGLEGSLRVQNTSTQQANQTGVAIYALGGNNFSTTELSSSIGIYGKGGAGASNVFSAGVYGESGSNAVTHFSHYAGYFKGRVMIDGNGDPASGDDYIIVGPQGIEFSCPQYNSPSGVPFGPTARFLDGDDGGNGSYSIRLCYRRTIFGQAGAERNWNEALSACTAIGMRMPTLAEGMLLGKRQCASNSNIIPSDGRMWTSTLNGGNPYAISGPCSAAFSTPQAIPTVGSTLFHVHCVY